MRIKRIATAALLAAAILLAPGCKKFDITKALSINGLPNFSVIMNNGESVNVLTLMGTPSVIVTFDPEDELSDKALSVVQSLYDEYRYKVKFITISSAASEKTVENYWNRLFLTLPYSVQEDDRQAKKFSETTPYIVVVDDNYGVKGSFGRDDIPSRTRLNDILKTLI